MTAALIKVAVGVAGALWGIQRLSKASAHRKQAHAAFLRFHDRIKHEQFGERELLRERREALLKSLESRLPSYISVTAFDQGSYAMQTGVKPLSGEFDLDLGLVFDCNRRSLGGPVEAKELVRDALAHGNRRVAIRRSCVTVNYSKDGRGDHHVDIAVYAAERDGKLYLAKGKVHSAPNRCYWAPCDPQGLTACVNKRFAGAELAQFRRCVRYLKRWKQVNFTTRAPYSIALTIAAFHWFKPNTGALLLDEESDLEALLGFVQKILANWAQGRLRIVLPVAPAEDLLHRMTGSQMTGLRQKLEDLESALSVACSGANFSESLPRLQTLFGRDFEP
jgi:hypothetical protein